MSAQNSGINGGKSPTFKTVFSLPMIMLPPEPHLGGIGKGNGRAARLHKLENGESWRRLLRELASEQCVDLKAAGIRVNVRIYSITGTKHSVKQHAVLRIRSRSDAHDCMSRFTIIFLPHLVPEPWPSPNFRKQHSKNVGSWYRSTVLSSRIW